MRKLGRTFDLTDSGGYAELGTREGFLFDLDYGTLFFDTFSVLSLYAPDGERVSVIEHEHDGTERSAPIDVVTLKDGSLAALYRFGAGHYTPHIRIYDADGAPLTDYIEVPDVGGGSAGNQANYSIAAGPDGGFSVMVGIDNSDADETVTISPLDFGTRNRNSDVRIAEFNADGSLDGGAFIGHETEEATSWTDTNIASRHDVLSNGDIVIAYTDSYYNLFSFADDLAAGTGVRASIIRDGGPIREFDVYTPGVGVNTAGRPIHVNEAVTSSTNYAPSVVALDTGGFAVIFGHNGTERGDPVQWIARFYGADGAQTGEVDLASGGSFAVGAQSPEFAALSGGRIAVVSAQSTSLTGREIYLKIIDDTGKIEGTKVAGIGVPQNETGIDGVDVGGDDTVYVSLYDGRVFRFAVEAGALESGADDRAVGRRGDDFALGDSDAEQFSMKNGDDAVFAGGGNDKVQGGAGRDSLEGQGGKDTLSGGDGRDVLLGQSGRDVLKGGNGNDTMFGGADHDIIRGGKGADILFGGAGNDLLIGGPGNDRFDFTVGRDTVGDFTDDRDTLYLASDLWEDSLTIREVVRTFATNTADGVAFDFGEGNSLLVQGIESRSDLFNDIVIL